MGGPTIVGITNRTLYLAPGERADVIVDFSRAPSGSKLILYNDAPAPAPLGDSRVDYYTGDDDLTVDRGRAEHRRGLRAQHAHDPAVPGRRRRLAGLRPQATAARPAGRLRRLPGSDPRARGRLRRRLRRPTGPRRRPREGRHAVVHATRPRLPADAAGAGQDGERAVRPRLRAQDGHPGRGRAALGHRRADVVPYSAIDPATEYLAVAKRAAAPRLGDGTQVWRITHDGTESHSISFGAFDVQVLARAQT